MTTKELSRYLVDEEAAEEYLKYKGILKACSECPKCGATHIGRVRRQRNKCYECKYEWNIRKESYLEGKHMSLSDFVGCLKFFADGTNATQSAKELRLNPKLTRLLFNDFRRILINTINLNIGEDEKVLLHIEELDGIIQISMVINNEIDNGAELRIVRSKDIDGAYLYKFDYKNFNVKNLLSEINKIDGIDNFYRYCQEQILTFRGRNINSMIDILQELAFRYNHRYENLFDLLIKKLASY